LIELAFGKDLNPDNYNNIAAGGWRGGVDETGKTRLFIARGRKDGYDAPSLVKRLKEEAGVTDHAIDDVKVLDEFSFATLPFADAELVLHTINKKRDGWKPIISKAKAKNSRSHRPRRRNDRRSRSRRR
jgi:ATP-dependent RNA helicase DeaD